nr:hypothetical protein [Tanacetum cinerariifolium]
MIDQGVIAALAARDALRRRMAMIAIILERVMESIFHISNCAVENQVKFATCTLHSVALTWWNTHVKTVGHDAAYGMPWKTLMKMMTDKYCPRNEIRKLEMEMWDLKVKGLPDMIHGSVVASKPKTMQEAVEITTELIDKKIRTFSERETTNKRKFENTSRNTQNQQQQLNKRQNTVRVYTIASGEKKQYWGSKPLCAKCNYHHDGPCAPKCHNCNKVGHFALGHAGTDPNANVVMVIAYAEKIVRIPWGNETLIIHGDGSNQGNATRLSIISCTKTEKYVMKGFPVFLAHFTTKEIEDKLEKKRLKDVPIVQNFLEVFPEDLPGLPPTRPVEFQID